jgi:PAS domain S-box-containing protein
MSTGNRERYHQLIDNVNDAVYTVDLKTGKFSSVNKAGEKLTGYSLKELLKMNFLNVIAPESIPIVKKKISQKVKKNVSTIYEIEVVRKDGTRLPVEVSSRAVYSGKDAVEILGVARNIKERKQLEHQKDIFLSLLTHEIKNPLTTIKGYTELLHKKSKDEKTKGYLTQMNKQIDDLVSLMNDFLEVSRVRVGKFDINKEEIDLKQLISEISESYQKGSKTHLISFEGKKAGNVLADKVRITQVLLNLVNNALKYSPTAGKVIIGLEKSKKEFIVSVQDFGVGIPKSDLKKVFDLFFRVNEEEHKKIKGYGLGLFISREIIKSHKGKIWAESEAGKGSTFFFTLPLK